jgi:hypothetical protein
VAIELNLPLLLQTSGYISFGAETEKIITLNLPEGQLCSI